MEAIAGRYAVGGGLLRVEACGWVSETSSLVGEEADLPSFRRRIRSLAEASVEKNPPASASQKRAICFCCSRSAQRR